MVKRIDSSKGSARSNSAAEVNRANSASDVDSVREVRGAKGSGAAARVRRPTRPMTAAERSELLRLVREEADQMLGGKLSDQKRDTIEQAVQMALQSGILDEE